MAGEYSAVINCGHGKSANGSWDPGCTYDGMTEAALMLPITKAMVKYTRASGVTVYSDADDGNDQNVTTGVAEANRRKVDVFVSLHCDWYKAPSGTMPLYCKGSAKGKKLAECLNRYVKSMTGIGTRGVTARTDLGELNNTNMPACIFETGSIKADRKEWDTAKECDEYGKALAKGLCDYFGIQFKDGTQTTAKKTTTKKTTTKYKTGTYAKRIKKGLKTLGYFNGEINSYITPEYTAAVLKFQKKAFKRKADQDGIGGSDTWIAVQTFVNFKGIKYFKPEEFRCSCGHCTGYPAVIDLQLLKNLEHLRKNFGAITITSGVRCKWKNSRLSGSASNSRHLHGKAADFYNAKLTGTAAKRRSMVKRWYGYRKARYSYANTAGMGNAVHVDVK